MGTGSNPAKFLAGTVESLDEHGGTDGVHPDGCDLERGRAYECYDRSVELWLRPSRS
jgi:hypothetical protein